MRVIIASVVHVLAQVYGELGDTAPDLENASLLRGFFEVMQPLVNERAVIAYHDRSDGGLFTTLVEMAFAGHTGLKIDLASVSGSDIERLYNEELGGVLQVSRAQSVSD